MISVGQVVDQSALRLWCDIDAHILFTTSWLNLDTELLRAASLGLGVHVGNVWLDGNCSECPWRNGVDDRAASWNGRSLTMERCCVTDGL